MKKLTERQKRGYLLWGLGLIIILMLFMFKNQIESLPQTWKNLVNLFATLGNILILYSIFGLIIEKPIKMNLPEKYLGRRLLQGLGVGGFLLILYMILAYFLGGLTYQGYGGLTWWGILLYGIGFGVQSFSEELLVRGIIQDFLTRRNLLLALVAPSLLFSLLHLFNDHFSWIAMINTFLIGLIFALMTYITGSLWMATGAHMIWNFLLGPIFGQPVSGNPMEKTLFQFPIVEGRELINGGFYGAEASVTVLIILALTTLIFIWISAKTNPGKRRKGSIENF